MRPTDAKMSAAYFFLLGSKTYFAVQQKAFCCPTDFSLLRSRVEKANIVLHSPPRKEKKGRLLTLFRKSMQKKIKQ